MANEATSTVSLLYKKGGREEEMHSISISSDVAGEQYAKTTMLVGTSGASLKLGGVAALGGLIAGRVISTTGTVTFYINGETDFLTLKAGDPFMFRLVSGAAVLVKASAADREIEYLLLEA
jgi:hypothetical protein